MNIYYAAGKDYWWYSLLLLLVLKYQKELCFSYRIVSKVACCTVPNAKHLTNYMQSIASAANLMHLRLRAIGQIPNAPESTITLTNTINCHRDKLFEWYAFRLILSDIYLIKIARTMPKFVTQPLSQIFPLSIYLFSLKPAIQRTHLMCQLEL